jgi:signal transduction histidine kinase
MPATQVVGTALSGHLPPSDRKALDDMLVEARTEPSRRELSLATGACGQVPVYLAASRLQGEGTETIFCLVLTDLTEVRLRSMDGYTQILLEQCGPKMEPECRRYLGLVREALEALEEQRAGRRVSIKVGELASCEGDHALLRQVWINLLSNALKFTRAAADAVIEIDSRVESGETVYRVKDNGAGFDMRSVDKLFKVFQRLHSASEYEGTGVGLAIVARIVERHGGRVWARSDLGRGAEFLFTLGGRP